MRSSRDQKEGKSRRFAVSEDRDTRDRYLGYQWYGLRKWTTAHDKPANKSEVVGVFPAKSGGVSSCQKPKGKLRAFHVVLHVREAP